MDWVRFSSAIEPNQAHKNNWTIALSHTFDFWSPDFFWKTGVENHEQVFNHNGLCSIAEPNRTQSKGLSLIRFDLFDQVWLVWKSNTQSAVSDLVWLKVRSIGFDSWIFDSFCHLLVTMLFIKVYE